MGRLVHVMYVSLVKNLEMGFLESGFPLDWKQTDSLKELIKKEGLKQLIHIYHLNKYREDTDLKWGDELEYMLVHLDHKDKSARLFLDGPKILEELECRERSGEWTDNREILTLLGARRPFLRGVVWHPEFGRHMIEATPNPPYELGCNSLLEVEDSMLCRRVKLQSCLPDNVYAVSMTNFPMFGLSDTLISSGEVKKANEPVVSCGDSIFLPDEIICPHPRFMTLVKNIVARRSVKTCQLIPVFKDTHTDNSPAWSMSLDSSQIADARDFRRIIAEKSKETPNPVRSSIYMDHFGFGMGQACLQMTYGAPNLASAKYLYDQNIVLAPIFLALSAATPMARGWLADTDVRWRTLEQGCDCRNDNEYPSQLPRTRFGAASLYISDDDYFNARSDLLNDVAVPIDDRSYRALLKARFPKPLAKHFASLWIRDPLVVFSDRIDMDHKSRNEHFENIQSTNWNSVRFKPPPSSPDGKSPSPMGWRVELRTPDIQLTDFENAAIASISALLSLAIINQHWRFYIPISLTHANMDTAHTRDAAKSGLFYFRIDDISDVNSDSPPSSSTSSSLTDPPNIISEIAQMTLREIFLGSRRTKFKGLLPMLDCFVSQEWRSHKCSRNAVQQYRTYADFIRRRVLGQTW